MKFLLTLAVLLLMAAQSGAETYSWIDDNGTYNFTEDYSKVPEKYQGNLNSLEDLPKSPASQVSMPPEKKSEPTKTPKAQPDSASGQDTGLFNGKSEAAWRQEFTAQEAELKKLEQRMELLQKQAASQPYLTEAQYALIKKDFDDAKVTYDQKYKAYSELVTSARKAGLVVEIKK